MIDLLFTAADLKEATVLTQARRQAAGEASDRASDFDPN